jgi:predicted dehydrogenase
MTRTRVAVVGGGFGRYALAPAFRRDPRCEVVAVCTRSRASAERVAAELGIARAYADPGAMFDEGGFDAVAIATPPASQPPIARLALERSVPVFAEKLLALTVEDARSLAEMAESARVANVVDYIFPEIEAWRTARDLLRDAYIGSLRHLAVEWMIESYDHRNGLETWKTDDASGGGVLLHFGPHVFYYLEWLMGSIARLSATVTRAPDSRRSGDTAVTLGLEFASGASGSVTLSTAAPLGRGHRVEIYGSSGALLLVNDSGDHVRGFRLLAGNRGTQGLRAIEPEAPGEPLEGMDARVGPVSRLASRFVDWIHTGQPTRPSFRDGLRVQLLLDAAARSHRTGSRVGVPQP